MLYPLHHAWSNTASLRPSATLFVLLLLIFVASPSLEAQSNSNSSPSTLAKSASLDEQIKELEAEKALLPGKNLGERETSLQQDLLSRALAALTEAISNRRQVESFGKPAFRLEDIESQRNSLKSLPRDAAEIVKALQRDFSPDEATLPAEQRREALMASLESLLSETRGQLATATRSRDDLRAERTLRDQRLLNGIPGEAAAARTRLEQVETLEGVKGSEGDSEDVQRLREVLKRAVVAREESALEMLEAERSRNSSVDRTKLLEARIALAEEQVEASTQREAAIRQELARLQQEKATELSNRLREASQQAANQVARDIAQQALELAQELSGGNDEAATLGLIERTTKAHDQLRESRKALELYSSRFKRDRDRVERIGMTNAIGHMLRASRDGLPDAGVYQSRQSTRAETVSALALEQERRRDTLASSSSVEAEYQALVATQSAELDEEVKAAIRRLVEEKYRLLQEVIRQYDTLLLAMAELEETESSLVRVLTEYRQFVNERILWIQSTEVLDHRAIGQVSHALPAWLNHPRWGKLLDGLFSDPSRHPLRFSLALLLALLPFALRRMARRILNEANTAVTKANAAPFGHTLRAMVATLVLASPVAILAALVAWRVLDLPPGDALFPALGNALLAAAAVVLVLDVVRESAKAGALGEVHFGWNPTSLAFIRRHFGWLEALVTASLLVYLCVVPVEELSVSLGRVAFLTSAMSLLLFTHIVLSTDSVLMVSLEESPVGKAVARLGPLWYLSVIAVPLSLIVLAVMGYYFTALELSRRLLSSLLLLLSLIYINALVSRWFYVMTQSLAQRRARQRRRSMVLQRQLSTRGKPSSGSSTLKAVGAEDDEISQQDIDAISTQSRQLRRTGFVILMAVGLAGIWRDVLPALGFMDNVRLWDRSVDGADGISSLVPVTLGNLFYGLLAIVLTVLSVKLIPGLLDMLLLRRLKLDRGGRFAIAALTRYTLILIGVLYALGELGVGWGEAQWLVAGLSVGLGFGLQEIFANFISGIIMLFERPVRVGDIVTVGGVSGTVTNISMRATTVQDFDRKELVIPNKQFITQELVNWSLSDDVLRVKIDVGVAYGSDTNLVNATLLKLAREHALVLRDPEPSSHFLAFGDNTLNFELRCFVSGADNFLRVRHELNMQLYEAFRDARIEIAFPQRVLHLGKESAEQIESWIGRKTPAPPATSEPETTK